MFGTPIQITFKPAQEFIFPRKIKKTSHPPNFANKSLKVVDFQKYLGVYLEVTSN